jgi:hypothetical protein
LLFILNFFSEDIFNRLFYGGHRKYLNADEVSAVEPPDEFKSKRQFRMARSSRQTASRNEDRFNFQMNFQKSKETTDIDNDAANNAKKFRKVANLIRSTITVDHFSSLHEDDWTEEFQAGVKIWVNKETGEVSTHCPFTIDPLADTSMENKGPEVDEEALGTGSLVYDSKEIDDLFSLLDKFESKKN